METQWPRFYVFEKPHPGADFIHAGSVHAADNEMALLIARDVFARRPSRTAMWIAPAEAIFSRTLEELNRGGAPEIVEGSPSQFQVFAKTRQKGVCVHQGTVEAADVESALAESLARFSGITALVWWIVPDGRITKSDEEEFEALYGSSPGKFFRHENHYPVRTMMRELMRKSNQDKEDEPAEQN